jgi:hypothetical protein
MTYISQESANTFWKILCDYLISKNVLVDVAKLSAIEYRQNPHDLSIQQFYLRLLRSLANRQGMPNSIHGIHSSENEANQTKEDIQNAAYFKLTSEVLCGFSPKDVVNKYPNWELLFNAFKERVKPISRMARDIPQNYWVVFSKGALDGAKFLSNFNDAKSFATEVSQFANNERLMAGLPQILALEIHGFGFPLACDFLKESGWTQYAKADVHTKKILLHANLSNGTDYDTFQAMKSIAKYVNETPYAVDKHIWLIGTGKLVENNKFSTSRSEFLKYFDQNKTNSLLNK